MPRMTRPPRDEAERALTRLSALVVRARREGWRGLSDEELEAFPHLYRRVSTLVAEEETAGQDEAELRRRRALLLEAHTLYRARSGSARELLRGLWRLYLVEVPRTVRAEWKLVASSFALLYGLSVLAALLVRSDLELAFSLTSPEMIGTEIAQLSKSAGAGEPFRGNFTFGLGESPMTAGWIMAHNMLVGVLFFGAGLVPPLFVMLLALNGLMLGSYTAVAMHWGQGWQISSILWCHGTLEIQAILLAGAGGLVLVRGWVAPGSWTRRHALTLESARALRLLAPVFPMLFLAGTIEAFVSPHAGQGVRLAVAGLSLVLMVLWFGFGGRGDQKLESSTTSVPLGP
jgi:uncharacterized membrane protein SpoIIM required for sporulation